MHDLHAGEARALRGERCDGAQGQGHQALCGKHLQTSPKQLRPFLRFEELNPCHGFLSAQAVTPALHALRLCPLDPTSLSLK